MPKKKEEKNIKNNEENIISEDLVPAKIKSIYLHPVQKVPVVFVVDEKDETVIPMIIGFLEAQAILAAWQKILFPRPLTADLLFRIIVDHFQAKIDKVIIYDVKDGAFFSNLYLITKDNQTLEVDSRPSDALALAIRANAPIFLTKNLVKLVEKDQPDARAMLEFLEKESEDNENIIKF